MKTCVLVCFLALMASCMLAADRLPVSGAEAGTDGQVQPSTQRQRVFTCGHSFHYFVPDILADLLEITLVSETLNNGDAAELVGRRREQQVGADLAERFGEHRHRLADHQPGKLAAALGSVEAWLQQRLG